ncbi:hypothetical protein OF83DRAFT_1173238 [Amylostereum chailletii]|nr:hypothetical protein OF83DRAFT_1173238 [Amylostereum chailletii]
MSLAYHLALGYTGMSDSTSATVSLSTRYGHLGVSHALWSLLQPIASKTSSLSEGVQFTMSSGGIMAFYRDDWNKGILFRRLPSQARLIEEYSWKIDVPTGTLQFRMDPSQDLLAVAVRGHEGDALTITAPTQAGVSVTLFDIYGPNAFVLCHGGRSPTGGGLFIYNWKTGATRSVLIGHEILSVDFISDDQVLLACRDDNARPGFSSPSIIVRNIVESSPREEPNPVTHEGENHHRVSPRMGRIVEFLLPDLAPSRNLASVVFHSDKMLSSPSAASGSHVPFYSARDDRLILIHIGFTTDGGRDVFFLLYVLSSTVCKFTTQYASPGDADGRVGVPWEAWGTTGTRVDYDPPWEPFEDIADCRFISRQGNQLVVLDFHPVRTRRPADGQVFVSEIPGDGRVRYRQEFAREMVEARLSCVERRMRLSDELGRNFEQTAVHLSEDTIVVAIYGNEGDVDDDAQGEQTLHMYSF